MLFFRTILVSSTALLLLLAHCSVSQAQLKSAGGGSSARQFRSEAIDAIPFDRLTRETQDRLLPVLRKPSLYRRLPTSSINIDPEHLRFLVRYPEVVVETWKLMGVTKMDTQRIGPFQMQTDDGAGTISEMDLVYGDSDTHVFFAEGSYDGPLIFRKLTGRCVILLRTVHQLDADGSPLEVNHLDVFLKVDNATASLIARTLQPIIGPTADHNFIESMNFLQRLDGTVIRNGPGVQQMAERLELSDDVRREYQAVVERVYDRNQPEPPGSPASSTQPATVDHAPAGTVRLTDSPNAAPVRR